MFRNAKILFCSGALQPRVAKDVNVKSIDTKDVIQNSDTVVNPIVINSVVKPKPIKPVERDAPAYSGITKSIRNIADNITEWFSGSGQQEKQDKHEDNKDVKEDL